MVFPLIMKQIISCLLFLIDLTIVISYRVSPTAAFRFLFRLLSFKCCLSAIAPLLFTHCVTYPTLCSAEVKNG